MVVINQSYVNIPVPTHLNHELKYIYVRNTAIKLQKVIKLAYVDINNKN